MNQVWVVESRFNFQEEFTIEDPGRCFSTRERARMQVKQYKIYDEAKGILGEVLYRIVKYVPEGRFDEVDPG